MLSVKYDDTTTWKIDGWLKNTLGHSDSNEERFGQKGNKEVRPLEPKDPPSNNSFLKDKPGERGNGLK